MAWSQRRKAGVAGLSVLVLAVGGGAVAVSAGPGSDNRVIGCYEKSTGDLRVVKRARQCRDDEKVLRWNKRGPRGHIGLPGADGTDGASILTGDGPPTNALGADGDYYVDTNTAELFGPKADGAWPANGTSLRGNTGPAGPAGPVGPVGPTGPAGADGTDGTDGTDGADGTDGTDGTDGRTILSGTAAPGAGVGNVGDFFLDTTNLLLYGPKTAGGWGTGTSIKGPKGDKGDKGDPGSGNVYSSSSGDSKLLTTGPLGLPDGVLVMPISGAGGVSGVFPPGGVVDLTFSGGMTQVIPDNATITSLTARMSTTPGPPPLPASTLTVKAQLHTSPTGTNVLAPVPGATCTMAPPLTGVILPGTIGSCSLNAISIPLSALTNAVFVISASVTSGAPIAAGINAFFSVSMSTS
jgi:hypothetical protein